MIVYAAQFDTPLLTRKGMILAYGTEQLVRDNTLAIHPTKAFLFIIDVPDNKVVKANDGLLLIQGEDVTSSRMTAELPTTTLPRI